MTTKQTVLAFLAALIVAVAGVSYQTVYGRQPDSLAEYYPFAPIGRTWVYVVNEVGMASGQSRTGTATFTALGAGKFEEKPTQLLAVDREVEGAKVSVINHFTVAPGSVQQVAVQWGHPQNPQESGWAVYSPPVPVGKAPLKVGDAWEASTRVTSPRQGQPDLHADSKRHVRVVRREAVTVPAGSFDALRIEIKTVTMREGARATTESTRIEWRAKGIGLVRLTEGPFELALKSTTGNLK